MKMSKEFPSRRKSLAQANKQRGASAIEYVVMLAVMTLVIVAALQSDALTDGITAVIDSVADTLPASGD